MARDRIPFGARVEVLDRANWHCWFCGNPIGAGNSTVTCLLPTARGGTTEPINLCAACTRCSAGKNGKTIEEYRLWLWAKSDASARAATSLATVLANEPNLPAYYRREIEALSTRLALAVPLPQFFGESAVAVRSIDA